MREVNGHFRAWPELTQGRASSAVVTACGQEGGPSPHSLGPQKVHSTCVLSAARPEDLTQSVTGLILPGADVQAGEQDGVVVASPIFPHQAGLPLAEAVQGAVRMVADDKPWLRRGEQDPGGNGKTTRYKATATSTAVTANSRLLGPQIRRRV